MIKRIAILDAGLIGIDAIIGLLHAKSVASKLSLVETNNQLLPRELNKKASITYEDEMIKKVRAFILIVLRNEQI